MKNFTIYMLFKIAFKKKVKNLQKQSLGQNEQNFMLIQDN